MATAVNDHQTIVGWLEFPLEDVPAFWSRDTGWTVLGLPAGFTEGRVKDVNNAGQMVGLIVSGSQTRIAWWVEGEVINLGGFPDANVNEATSINAAGQIVGVWGSTINGPFPQAFVYQNFGLIDITPDLPGTKGEAQDINDAGQITGWSGESAQSDARAFIWRNGLVTELPPIPGGFTSVGIAINIHGHVAVEGKLKIGEETVVRSFLWRDETYTDLGLLPETEEARVTDINDDDVIIGDCDGTPFFWRDGIMRNLQEAIAPDATHSRITSEYGLNGLGQIVGIGTDTVVENRAAVLLTPLVTIAGDLNGDGDVDASDLVLLLGVWGPCDDCIDCSADFDADCTVGASDLIILLGNWG